jgi:hypothetical protein
MVPGSQIVTNDKELPRQTTRTSTSARHPHLAVSTVVLDMIILLESLSTLYDNRRPMHEPGGRNTVYVRYLEVMTWRQKHPATRTGTTMVLYPAHTTLRCCLAVLYEKTDRK